MKTLFSLFLLVFSLAALAQEPANKPEKPKRRLSFSQLFKEIEECKDTIYRLENAEIDLQNIEERFGERYLADSITAKLDTIYIKPQIELKNVSFLNGNVVCFRKMKFERQVLLQQIKQPDLRIVFDNCLFEQSLILNENIFYVIQISNNRIKDNMNVFKTNTYYDGFCFQIYDTQIDNYCSFTDLDNLNLKITYSTIKYLYSEDIRGENNVMSADESIINYAYFFTTKLKKYDITNSQLNKIKIYVEENKVAVINNITVKDTLFWLIDTEKSLDVVDCKIGSVLGMNITNLPNENTHFRWKLISKKLLFQDGSESYRCQSIEELADEDRFSKLMAIYFRFYAIYKFCGDMESANACYVEMKEIETRKLKYDHEQKNTLKTFLDWQMNEFLHTFSDYGTDYVKSLIYAFYVILGFSLVYFIFPSQEDNLSKNRFLKFFTKAIHYFKTDTQLTDFQQEKRKEELEKLENFKQNLVNSQTEIPRIISLLGKPFYYQNLYFTEFALWLLHRTDLAKGKWSEIPAKRKLFLGGLVTVYFVFYVLNGIFMRAINAFALSLNFFTTLGYGEMQARGWIKYLAVLEGAVGWFLLTVFSASLVSQLLQ